MDKQKCQEIERKIGDAQKKLAKMEERLAVVEPKYVAVFAEYDELRRGVASAKARIIQLSRILNEGA